MSRIWTNIEIRSQKPCTPRDMSRRTHLNFCHSVSFSPHSHYSFCSHNSPFFTWNQLWSGGSCHTFLIYLHSHLLKVLSIWLLTSGFWFFLSYFSLYAPDTNAVSFEFIFFRPFEFIFYWLKFIICILSRPRRSLRILSDVSNTSKFHPSVIHLSGFYLRNFSIVVRVKPIRGYAILFSLSPIHSKVHECQERFRY